MIISFKYKFIFIKTYKTAGSSIESYLYQFLDTSDVIAHTVDNNGAGAFNKNGDAIDGEIDDPNKIRINVCFLFIIFST